MNITLPNQMTIPKRAKAILTPQIENLILIVNESWHKAIII